MSNDAPFIRPVPQILPGTALTVSTGKPRGSLSFPTAGGVQAVDETGAVLDLAGAGGAVTATVTDAVTNAASTALSLVHALSAGVGANGIGVTQRFLLPNSLGVSASAGQFTVSYTDATSGSEDSALGITLQVGGAGTGVLTLTAPTAGATTLTAAGSASASLNLVGAGGIAIAPTAVTSGAQTALTVTGIANTGQTTTVEVPDVLFNLARTVTWAAGDITAQRAVKVTAPTYSIPAGVGTRTITTASTMSLSGAPALAAGTILARSYALFVESGVTNLAGGVGVSNATNNNAATTISAVRLVDSAASGVAGVGANGIASRITLTAPNNAGTQTFAGFVTGTLTDVTAAAEVSQLSLGGAFANSGCEALRLIGLTGTIVNRLDITPAADSGIVTVAVAGGATAGSIAISANGVTGVTSLRGSVATNIVAVDNGGGASAPRLGFYNVGPVARQVLATGGGATVDQVITALQNLGLLAQA